MAIRSVATLCLLAQLVPALTTAENAELPSFLFLLGDDIVRLEIRIYVPSSTTRPCCG